jgi:hypothetical protein
MLPDAAPGLPNGRPSRRAHARGTTVLTHVTYVAAKLPIWCRVPVPPSCEVVEFLGAVSTEVSEERDRDEHDDHE